METFQRSALFAAFLNTSASHIDAHKPTPAQNLHLIIKRTKILRSVITKEGLSKHQRKIVPPQHTRLHDTLTRSSD